MALKSVGNRKFSLPGAASCLLPSDNATLDPIKKRIFILDLTQITFGYVIAF